MLVAMFLTKDMGIDWKLGERYFAQHLVDYDPSSNSGGWQGMAIESPNFRILNPWVQSEKFDKDAVFIKKWIPLLSNVPAKAIHNWWREHVNYNKGYPVPMLDHKESISGL
jgi:deoxyribodipyrimidine photo-lyase